MSEVLRIWLSKKDPEQTERKVLHQFVDFAGKRVLEIGCGEGRLTWQYAKPARLVVGIDPDADGLRIAAADRPTYLQQVAFSRADSIYPPFCNEAFDIAILAWSL